MLNDKFQISLNELNLSTFLSSNKFLSFKLFPDFPFVVPWEFN